MGITNDILVLCSYTCMVRRQFLFPKDHDMSKHGVTIAIILIPEEKATVRSTMWDFRFAIKVYWVRNKSALEQVDLLHRELQQG